MNELMDMLQCFESTGTYLIKKAKNITVLMCAEDTAQGSNVVKKLQDMIDDLSNFG